MNILIVISFIESVTVIIPSQIFIYLIGTLSVIIVFSNKAVLNFIY